MPKNLVIASFDPASSRNIGWSVISVSIEDKRCSSFNGFAGTFVMPKTEEIWQVLWPMQQAIDEFLLHYKPDVVLVEKTSSFAGGFVTGQVSNCMGVILSCCGKYGLDVKMVYPTHVKKVVTGKGRATKTQIKKSVTKILTELGAKDIKFDSEHAYDATSNILCYMFDAELLDNPTSEEK